MSKRKFSGQCSITNWCKRGVGASETVNSSLEQNEHRDESVECFQEDEQLSEPTAAAATTVPTSRLITAGPIIDVGMYFSGGELAEKLTDEIRYRILSDRFLPSSHGDMKSLENLSEASSDTKITERPGSARTRWGSLQRSPRPPS